MTDKELSRHAMAILRELVKWEADPDRYGGDLANIAHKAKVLITKWKGNQ